VGDAAAAGEPLCTLLVNHESALESASAMILSAYSIGESPIEPPSPIVERM
jgi:hypothetical protein